MRKTTLAALLLLLSNVLLLLYAGTLPAVYDETLPEDATKASLTALTHIEPIVHINGLGGDEKTDDSDIPVQIVLKTVDDAAQSAVVYPSEAMSVSVKEGVLTYRLKVSAAQELRRTGYAFEVLHQHNMATDKTESSHDPQNALWAEYNKHAAETQPMPFILLVKVPRALKSVSAAGFEDIVTTDYRADFLFVRNYNQFFLAGNSHLNRLTLRGKGDIYIEKSRVDSLLIDTNGKPANKYFSAIDLHISNSRMGSLLLKADCLVRGLSLNDFRHVVAEPVATPRTRQDTAAFQLEINNISQRVRLK